MPWTVFPNAVECRAVPNGGCQIPAGSPVFVLASAPRVVRCERHAPVAVDQAAVDAARHRLEAERDARRQATATQLTFAARPREPFDARMAAAGERDS